MKDIYFEKFETLADFSHAINTRPTDSFYKDPSSMCNDFEFTGTHSWDEAEKLLLEGDKETADKIAHASKIKPATAAKTAITRGPVGFVPNVPAYLAGNPNNMLGVRTQSYKSTKVVNLVVDRGIRCGVQASEILEFGAKVLGIVKSLEQSGYRCNLYVSKINEYKKTANVGVLLVKIKDSGKPLNLTKVAYPLCHPSFPRRHGFRWVETTKRTKDLVYGYGLAEEEDARKCIAEKFKQRFIFISTRHHIYDSFEGLEKLINNQL